MDLTPTSSTSAVKLCAVYLIYEPPAPASRTFNIFIVSSLDSPIYVLSSI